MNWKKKRFANSLMKAGRNASDPEILRQKQKLFQNLSGTVVEIGPGAGVNLKLYPKTIHWIGVEPNPFFEPFLQEEIKEQGIASVEIKQASGERLPIADASADVVVATQVLCSVKSQEQALKEIIRVLKPGGRYLFLEHVAAPRGTLLRFWQNLLNPINRITGGGCNLNRETLAVIERAGFSKVQSESFKAEKHVFLTQVSGVAQK